MRIIRIKEVEDCFDDTKMKDVLLDRKISKEFILALKEHGYLQYFPAFAKPFFKFHHETGYILKGIEGNKSIRVIYSGEYEDVISSLKNIIENFLRR